MPECEGCERSDCAERGCVASAEIRASALRGEAKRLAQIGCSTHVLSLIRKHADEIDGAPPSSLPFCCRCGDRITPGTMNARGVVFSEKGVECGTCTDDGTAEDPWGRIEERIAAVIADNLGEGAHVDGAGCESGDPRDVLAATVNAALVRLVNERDEMVQRCGEAADYMKADGGRIATLEAIRTAAFALREHARRPRVAWSGAAKAVHEQLAQRLDALLDGAPPQLTFEMLRMANVARCSRHYHPIADWSLSDWCTAVAGELGELAGVIKNLRRAETERANGHVIPQRGPLVDALAEEAADVVIYLDLLCARAAVDLGAAVTRKFNEVSRHRLGSSILLPEEEP